MILGKNAQNVQKITDLIKENPRTTLLELEQDTGISKTTIGRIVTKDLKLKKTPAKFIPRFLTNEQKLCRLATCENMLEMTRTDPEWKDKIITGDETWVYDYDPETKRQYAEWRGQDIAPNDFFLFPKLKAVLKGRHFDTRDDIIEKSPLALKSIPKELYKTVSTIWGNDGAEFGGESPVGLQRHHVFRDQRRIRRLRTFAAEEMVMAWSSTPTGKIQDYTSLVSLVLAEQPLVMELSLVSPASCELRSVIRFLAAKKNSAKEIYTELCQVYGEGCMSSGMVRRCVREFKNGRTYVHDERRAGRPSVSDESIAKVEAAMFEVRRVTAWKLCDLVPDVSKSTIDKILREHLGYSKVCAIWVPKMLTEDHKRQRVDAAQKFLDCHKTDEEEFLDSIVTGNVTWVHYTTPETKEQSKQWKHTSSPKPLKFKQTLSAGKLIATVFWDRKGLLLCDNMRRGTTINSDRYCETLKKLRRAIQNKRRGMLTKGVRFHHDNARSHTTHQTTALIKEFGWELVSHPLYSPDVAPSDFPFFPEWKKNLGGTQFQDDDELEEAVLGFLRGQEAEFFDSGFHKWVSRMQKCVERNGEYVEK
ncbi:hypothetical protein LAZ67_8003324 [Cordylochernes scorpioides]|uniref:Mos1 transposase HTH domain-containing protein n=1 Tax=Cordylochernes scorpioides TaxID=51811 RepID=A0ABY6KUP9_9ARAC|nr:hypothetical protein LAZ67_8003324 [Cordylochernes scorpioides]